MTVRVTALLISTYAPTKGGQHFLDHKVNPTPQEKNKVKDVIYDKLPSRNYVTEFICYLSFGNKQPKKGLGLRVRVKN